LHHPQAFRNVIPTLINPGPQTPFAESAPVDSRVFLQTAKTKTESKFGSVIPCKSCTVGDGLGAACSVGEHCVSASMEDAATKPSPTARFNTEYAYPHRRKTLQPKYVWSVTKPSPTSQDLHAIQADLAFFETSFALRGLHFLLPCKASDIWNELKSARIPCQIFCGWRGPSRQINLQQYKLVMQLASLGVELLCVHNLYGASSYPMETEAARRKRLAIFEGAMYTNFYLGYIYIAPSKIASLLCRAASVPTSVYELSFSRFARHT
jgi:hypothetical protein